MVDMGTTPKSEVCKEHCIISVVPGTEEFIEYVERHCPVRPNHWARSMMGGAQWEDSSIMERQMDNWFSLSNSALTPKSTDNVGPEGVWILDIGVRVIELEGLSMFLPAINHVAPLSVDLYLFGVRGHRHYFLERGVVEALFSLFSIQNACLSQRWYCFAYLGNYLGATSSTEDYHFPLDSRPLSNPVKHS